MPAITLDQIVQWVEEVPALPNVAVKVLKMTEDPMVSARDIGNTIAVDVALTSRVLRIANSAYYGMPRSISTVQEAVVILGMQVLRNLALAAASYDMLKREFSAYGLAAGELWRHSIMCALASQIIAKETRAVRSEEAFVAGLLHDIGKVILNVHAASQFQAIMALAELDALPFHEAEKAVLGFDHAEVGARLAEKWNLPHALCSAIGGHHDLSQDEDAPQLTAVVHVANYVCKRDLMGLGTDRPCSSPKPEGLALLRLTEDDLEGVADELIQQMERAKASFEF